MMSIAWQGLVGLEISEVEVAESSHQDHPHGRTKGPDLAVEALWALKVRLCRKPAICAVCAENSLKRGNSTAQLLISSMIIPPPLRPH